MKVLFRRIWLPLLLMLGFSAPVQATHIVGGEFGLTYIKRGQYDLRLTLYFDAINGSVGAIDTAVRVFIFPKRPGSAFSKEIIMQLDPDIEFVAYTNPDCQFTDGAVRTRILTYVKRIALDPDQFADTLGYYVVWERCCRNGTITNITDPGSTGQTFYLEFPSIRRGPGPADTLKNSSPTLFKPLSDFACVNQPFEFDFSGQDPDRDSLVYALVPPYAGNTTASNPGQYPQAPAQPFPEPYRFVTWAPGFSNTIQINGTRPIGIDSRTGVLRMTAGRTGLFVFAIECREYRRGTFLGRVRREFQVFVRDCPQNTPPKIVLRDSSGRQLGNGDTLVIWQKPNTNDRCFSLSVRDSLPDAEVLSGVSAQLGAGFSISQERGNTTRGVFSTQICFDDCLALTAPRFANLTLRVRDNFCSIPSRDSLKIVVEVRPVLPVLSTLGLVGYAPYDTILTKDGPFSMDVLVADSLFNVDAEAFITPTAPTSVQLLSGSGRRKVFRIATTIPCLEDTLVRYTLTLVGKVVRCGVTYTDTLRRTILFYKPPFETTLSIRNSRGELLDTNAVVIVQPGQPLQLTATGLVSDGNNLVLSAGSTYAASVANAQTRSGPSPQTLALTWTPSCADLLALQPDSIFKLTFRTEAENCIRKKTADQTVRVLLKDTTGGPVRVGNIITVNDDGANDAFRLWDPKPLENCSGKFEGVDIYDRWGKRIYHSDDIAFAWKPTDGTGSLYFYRLVFQGRQYRGWVETVIPR